jgi:hypothetical protein
MRNAKAYKIWVEKPEDMRPLGKPRPTWENNIKTDHKETGSDDMKLIHLTQDRASL